MHGEPYNELSDGNHIKGFRKKRALLVLCVLLALCVAAVLLAMNGPGFMPWKCLLHELTGLHCPGCGMTRATHAALHGDFMAAVRFNPVGVFLLPLALLLLAPDLIAWTQGRPAIRRSRFTSKAGWFAISLLIIFAILRNIPHYPFTLLAPPSC